MSDVPDTSERVVFPLVTGWNSPSYVLEALKTLLALGVPEENLRFLPVIGHFALPEVCGQEPPGPAYDPETGRATVSAVIPTELRPRLTVSVRAETVMRFWQDAEGNERHDERVMGRLAHFLPPLLIGIPGLEPESADTPETPLDRLTRHVVAAYPELLATLPPPVQEALVLVADEMMALLGDSEAEAPRRGHRAAQALRYVADAQARADCRASFHALADKIPAESPPGIADGAPGNPQDQFRRWADIIFGPGAEAEGLEREAAALSPPERAQQHALWRAFQKVVSFETVGERGAIIRELMEILTTEAFLAVAALDAMNGIGWIHGRLSDICIPVPTGVPEGLLLSVTGGQHRGSLLLTLMQSWAASPDGVLGVRQTPEGAGKGEGKGRSKLECLDLSMLDETEQLELLSLATWRREASDVRVLLELAAQRLVHPEVKVQWQRFQPAPSRLGMLMAQPGQTAVLGGQAVLQFPGLTILVPLAEDTDEDAARAKAVLSVLQRLFVPVTCRVAVVWQEAVARLDGGSYLQHDFQRGARLTDTWSALTQSADEDAAEFSR